MAKRRHNGQGTLFRYESDGPWISRWYDHTGRRRERSTRTTDRRTAERILGKHLADSALRRDGVVNPAMDRFAEADRLPLSQHIEEYLEHCRRVGQAPKAIAEKVRHLHAMLDGTGATRLADLTPDALERHLWQMQQAGKAARTVNFARQIAVAFASWAKKTGRLESNPLGVVPKLDENADRRRVRRPLSDEELVKLLDVAAPRGRRAWYLTAALAGLRLGDLRRLTWGAIDFVAGTITISDGKAKRVDVLPLHPQLAAELKARRDAMPALPMAKVFSEVVTNITVQKDLLRAGLARREVVTGADGKPVMIGKGKRQRPKTRIITEDDQGRVIDLHALRTTLGTNLAKAGIAPQLAQRIMRHSDYRTTLKHYTVLGVADTAKAIGQLPDIEWAAQAIAATAGGGDCSDSSQPTHLKSQQLRHETRRDNAKRSGGADGSSSVGERRKPFENGGKSDLQRPDAKPCVKAGDRIRTGDVQLGKLAFYH